MFAVWPFKYLLDFSRQTGLDNSGFKSSRATSEHCCYTGCRVVEMF